MRKSLFYLILVSFLLTPFNVLCKDLPDYEIEGAGIGAQGVYLVSITIITKNKNVSDRELETAAVHGVLFRGFSDPKGRSHQKPLAGSPANEAEHIDFYKEFFGDKGTAHTYASTINGSRSILKSGKAYKVSVKATVRKEDLYNYLSGMGIIKGLNSIF
ncbi:MAG: hypothetical protein K2M88_05890 [Muribaculaceae bacterium]|nr:hypothetical protein [Muribaculaceae bacterium]